jgi:hypothetical protein
MLSNRPNNTSSTAKLPKYARLWPVSVALAMLAVFIIASTGSAASPQPQSQPQSQPAQSSQPPQSPNAACPPDGQCFADVPSSSPFYAFINRIYQQDLVTGYPCGGPNEPCDPAGRPYYRPVNNVTRQQMAKFIDNARRLPEIYLEASSTSPLIYANNDSGEGIRVTTRASFGVYSTSTDGVGVRGDGGSGGLVGTSTNSYGVTGSSINGIGVRGTSSKYYGVYGYSPSSQAGHFVGSVQVTGNLSKGGGSFKIDHPLDPASQYLYHSFVESPDMMNVYNGNVITDEKGDATVQLPEWFEALNRDFRYQLTIMGDQFAQARVSSKVKDNHFSIKTDKPNVEVSWQVTGIRQDPYANAHRIPLEQDKPANEKGKYLHPTEWGQPESSGIDYEEQQKMQEMTQSKP